MKKIVIGIFLLLTSCSYLVKTPTTTYETYPRPSYVAEVGVKDSDILIDARPFFYYSSTHIAGAYHEDIKKYFEKKTTWPKLDLFAESRVLARKGVHPNARVIILGQGKQGKGEECRLAWTLFYLGVKDVQFVKEDTVKAKRVVESNPPLKDEVTYWEPSYRKALLIERQDLVKDMQLKTPVKIVDTRSESQFLRSKFPWDAEVDTQVLNIPWQEFLSDKNGRPNLTVTKRLESLGLKKSDPIVVIDEDGIGASCAAMTLIDSGYTKVKLYAGGYNDLRQVLKD
jgi:thiosulfate/3-mercaptopyruvate sulfurtransferase